MATDKQKTIWRVLVAVDWPKVIHQGATYVRTLRGDQTVAADGERAQQNASRTRAAIEQMGRSAAGCRLPEHCECAFCEEGKTP